MCPDWANNVASAASSRSHGVRQPRDLSEHKLDVK